MTKKKTTRKTTSKKASTKKPPAGESGSSPRGRTILRGDGKTVTVTVPDDEAPAPRPRAKTPKPATTKSAPEKQTKAAKPKRVSLLDAAATVLRGEKQPMTARAIVEAVTAKGLWKSPGGKTPHATLYAAMIREIRKKGKDARFEKVDRGQFAARKTP